MLGCALPARADAADIIVRHDPGLKASERADIRSDAGVKLDRMLPLADTEVVSAPEGAAERAKARA